MFNVDGVGLTSYDFFISPKSLQPKSREVHLKVAPPKRKRDLYHVAEAAPLGGRLGDVAHRG